jgi:CHAD domain-containing protein
MAIDTSTIRDNIQKLRKALKKTRKSCTPDVAHIAGFSANLLKREQDCLVQLFEHLEAERYKQAARLRSLAKKFGPHVRKELKTVARHVDQLNGKSSGANQKQASSEASGFALRLSGDLDQPTTLNRGNLHEYRLKIKELEYVLKMADSDAQEKFVDALDECKDAIGEWHDWEELIAIAGDVLDHGRSCKLMRQLMQVSANKLDRALSMANKMRKTFVAGVERTRKGGSSGHAQPRQPVLKALSAISTNANAKWKTA